MPESKPLEKEKKPLGPVEKVIVSLFGVPIVIMISVGLMAVTFKFIQICWEWVS